jgi:hypothetical protein
MWKEIEVTMAIFIRTVKRIYHTVLAADSLAQIRRAEDREDIIR